MAPADDGEPTPSMNEATQIAARAQPSLRSASASAASRRSHSFRAGLRKNGSVEDELQSSLRLMDTKGQTEPDGQSLLGQSTDSFYFRVTAKLCSPLTLFDWRIALDTLLVFLAMTLQVMALTTVWYMYGLYSRYGDGDDKTTSVQFPAGVPRPTNIDSMLDEGSRFFFYVPILAFCTIALLAEIRAELAEAHIGYILMRHRWSDFLAGGQQFLGHTEPGTERGPVSSRWVFGFRLVLAANIGTYRLALLLYFLDSSIFLLGSSDGPLDIILNSLALIFILSLDNYITHDLPEENLFRLAPAKTLRQEAVLWACTRSVFDRAMKVAASRPPWVFRAYQWMVLVSRLCIGLMMVAMSMKLQRKTMQSIFLSFDDDGYWDDDDQDDQYQRHNTHHITKVFNLVIWLTLLALLVECHAALAFCSKLAWWRHAVDFVVEFVWVCIFRSIILNYLLTNLTYDSIHTHRWTPFTIHTAYKYIAPTGVDA